MDLFSYSNQNNLNQTQPLAVRMRPRDFNEFIGHEDIVGKKMCIRDSTRENSNVWSALSRFRRVHYKVNQ